MCGGSIPSILLQYLSAVSNYHSLLSESSLTYFMGFLTSVSVREKKSNRNTQGNNRQIFSTEATNRTKNKIEIWMLVKKYVPT